jgi:hypothetical protein
MNIDLFHTTNTNQAIHFLVQKPGMCIHVLFMNPIAFNKYFMPLSQTGILQRLNMFLLWINSGHRKYKTEYYWPY